MLLKAAEQLSRWGIPQQAATAAGIFPVDDASQLYPEFKPLPALVLPYFTVSGDPVTFDNAQPFCRVRYLSDIPQPGSFVKQKPLRYGQPQGSGTRAFFPVVAGVDWAAIAQDATVPLIITEGEAKALAATLAGFTTIGLGGVYNFLRDGGLLPELAAFKWHKREVFICFDSDAATNPNIQAAEARLVDELMRSREARVYLVRMPPLDSGEKCGIDDFLLAYGPEKLEKLLLSTDALGAVDAAVVALNRHVAWVERDGQVYDIRARHFLKTEAFTRGGQYSTIKARRVITTGKKPGVKEVAVAQEWLTHPLARRYADLLFRPGEGALVETDHGQPAFNVWHGWDAPVAGDVQPFLDLYNFLMSTTPAEHRDLPIRLLAYKAQNPQIKIPLALVLIGAQGSGKTLFTECVQAAFAPYDVTLPSSSLREVFQGWLERSLLAVINEVEPEDLLQGRDRLKALISDLKRPMNEKYRVARQINSYTLYILTANERAAGAFSHGDRRMIVIGCPEKREYEFYSRVHAWKAANGGARLLHYLLNLDLKGWIPPAEAPMTPEKFMAYQESLSGVQKLADDTMTADRNIVFMWIDAAMTWARSVVGNGNPALARHAQEIIDSYNTIQIRPWYSPTELAMMFPQIAAALYGSKRTAKTVAGEMSRELRDCGVQYLECADDPRGFKWQGRIHQFLIIADRSDVRSPISQAEFDRQIELWPRYAEVKQALKNRGSIT